MLQPPGPHKGEGEGPVGKGLMPDDSLSTTKTAASGCTQRAQALSKHSTYIVI